MVSPRRIGAIRGAVALACTAAVLLAGAARAADVPPLSPEQLKQLLKVDDNKGSRIPLPDPVKATLALTTEQVKDGVKQVMFEDSSGVRHGFAQLSDHSGYFMVRREANSDHTVFHVDDKLKLVKAARNFAAGERLIALPPEEAERQLQEEFAQWSKVLVPAPAKASAPASAPATATTAPPASKPAPSR
jgi:hypothetical protein